LRAKPPTSESRLKILRPIRSPNPQIFFFVAPLPTQLDPNNKGSPIIVVQFLLQQINCIYSLKSSDEDGEKIVEGSPDDIRQNVYMMGFQRVFEEETGDLTWKVVDLQLHVGNKYI